jgi:alkanesulfonate monooxygenase SsuD/methylene tetrahydromethanopterin reductase-like flavin-dependent oxidoreductase (luciferase family)
MAHNRKAVDEGMIAELRPILGPPSVVADRLNEYAAAGVPEHIVEVPAPYDVETLERLAGEVRPLLRDA